MGHVTARKDPFRTAINRIERAMGSTRNGNVRGANTAGAALSQDIAIATAMAVGIGDHG